MIQAFQNIPKPYLIHQLALMMLWWHWRTLMMSFGRRCTPLILCQWQTRRMLIAATDGEAAIPGDPEQLRAEFVAAA